MKKREKICPVCGKNLYSKEGRRFRFRIDSSTYGPHHMRCPFCNARLRVVHNWRIIPLLVLLYLSSILCSYHFIFKVSTVLICFIIYLYWYNLPYKPIK